MPFYLGIDQSLSSTGITVVGAENDFPTGTIIAPPKGLAGAERLLFIKKALMDFLKVWNQPPAAAAMEAYAYNATGKLFELGELGGVLKLALLELAIPVTLVAPVQLKKFLSGNPQATKEQIRIAIQNRYLIDIPQDDLADAFGLAQIAKALALNTSVSMVRAEVEVLKALRSQHEKKPALRALATKGISA